MELKPNEITQDNLAQAISQVIAANILFTKQADFPPPVGVLTDLMDQWILIWIGKNGMINYSDTECKKTYKLNFLDGPSNDNKPIPISRSTAMHFIDKHLNYINDLLNPLSQKRRIDHLNPEVFGFEAGKLMLRAKVANSDTQMEDVFDVMSREEIENYQVHRALKSMDFLLSPAAEKESSCSFMYS